MGNEGINAMNNMVSASLRAVCLVVEPSITIKEQNILFSVYEASCNVHRVTVPNRRFLLALMLNAS